MRITLTLRGSLARYLPAGTGRYSRPLEVAVDATVGSVLKHLALPEDLVHLVLVNGEHVPSSQLGTTPLHAEDTLAIWPPLSGG